MTNTKPQNGFLNDVLQGLQQPQAEIPSKYLYDELGSALFEAITVTPEYYVTDADLATLTNHLPEITAAIGERAHVIEFGSGAGVKTQLLLEHLQQPSAYSPIEISAAALQASARHLQNAFPNLLIRPVQADYTNDIPPEQLDICPDCNTRVVYFPGSTIGNFDAEQAQQFLQRFQTIITAFAPEVNGGLLIGFDLLKDIPTLIAAYDDEAGVTSAFNKNLLARLKRELGADIDLHNWIHEARFNDELARIEMHLVSVVDQTLCIDDQTFEFPAGSSIHTESSHKYTLEGFADMASAAGLTLAQHWSDPDERFATCYFVPAQQSVSQ